MTQPDPIADLLSRAKTIAVVGLSCNPLRPSHGVTAYMQGHGYRIIPVNPHIDECLGEKAYASLPDVPEKIDIVNIFRRPEFVEEIVDQAIQLKVPAIWMQEDVDPPEGRRKGAPGWDLRRYGSLHPERTSRAIPVRRESPEESIAALGGVLDHDIALPPVEPIAPARTSPKPTAVDPPQSIHWQRRTPRRLEPSHLHRDPCGSRFLREPRRAQAVSDVCEERPGRRASDVQARLLIGRRGQSVSPDLICYLDHVENRASPQLRVRPGRPPKTRALLGWPGLGICFSLAA